MSTEMAYGNPKARMYPAQGLVRILKGNYPNLPKLPSSGKSLDIGCGDGRNTEFLQELGFESTGTEVDTKSVSVLEELGEASYVQARSSYLPFENNSFNLVVAWHSIYYLDSDQGSLLAHLREVQRVLAKDGAVVLSIPKISNFIFENSESHAFDSVELAGVGRRVIKSDPFGLRAGQLMATVENISSFKDALEVELFSSVQVAEEAGDWFGLSYDWWDLVCFGTNI